MFSGVLKAGPQVADASQMYKYGPHKANHHQVKLSRGGRDGDLPSFSFSFSSSSSSSEDGDSDDEFEDDDEYEKSFHWKNYLPQVEHTNKTKAVVGASSSSSPPPPRQNQLPPISIKKLTHLVDELTKEFTSMTVSNNCRDSSSGQNKSSTLFTDRIHYNTTAVVHDPVAEWAFITNMKEINKIENYDHLKEFKLQCKMIQSSKNKSGDQRVQELRFWLDNLGMTRHVHQIRFHEHMIRASLTKIYENEWEADSEAIMKKFSVPKMQRELLFSCPRRYGKTYSVAMFVTAYSLTVPNCQTALFSTGQRTVKKLMTLIVSFFARYPGFHEKLAVSNQEDLEMKFGDFDKRRLSCYPSSVRVCILSFLSFLLLRNVVAAAAVAVVVVVTGNPFMSSEVCGCVYKITSIKKINENHVVVSPTAHV